MKKRIICLVLALFMCLSLIACSSETGKDSDASPDAQTQNPDEQPKSTSAQQQSANEPVNLVVGTTKQPEGESILSQAGMFGRFNYNSVVYANFFYEDEHGNAQPYFLDSFEISADGHELKMTFPTTAIWHDGKPVTADDVAFTFEYRRDVMKSSTFKSLTEIKIDSENSVTLVFSEPKAYSFVNNAFQTFMVLPKHIWENIEDYSSYTGEDAAIGCGPYRLAGVDEDAGTMYFEAVPENAFLGELTIDTITLKSYSSQDSLLMAMANGDIDVMYDYSNPIDYTLLGIIESNDDIYPGTSHYAGNYQVTLGMNRAANMVYEFREAAVKSLDWELITQVINGQYGKIPGSGIIAPPNPGFDSSLWMFYRDLDEANALLDDAGFLDGDGDGFRELPDGSAFTYKICGQFAAGKQEIINRIGEVLVASLAKVGVNAYYDQESLVSTEANNKLRLDCDYDMYIGYTTTGVASGSTAFFYFVNKNVEGGGGALGEGWGDSYDNEKLNAAYAAMRGAINNDAFIAAVRDMQRIASEELFAFALCWEECFFPYRTDKFEGFENYPSVGVVHDNTFYTITPK